MGRLKMGGTGSSAQNCLKALLSDVVLTSNLSWRELGGGGLDFVAALCAMRKERPLTSRRLWASGGGNRTCRCWRAGRPKSQILCASELHRSRMRYGGGGG